MFQKKRSKMTRKKPGLYEEDSDALQKEHSQMWRHGLGDSPSSRLEYGKETFNYAVYNEEKIGDSSLNFLPDVKYYRALSHVWLLPIAKEHYWIHCPVLVRVDWEK
jgi:hypothetical protein